MKFALFSTIAATALVVIGAFRLGRSEPAARSVPPIATPRLRTLWSGDEPVINSVRPTSALAPEEEAPAEEEALVVRAPDEAPELLNRRELEAGVARARAAVEECRDLEQFVGMLKVKITIAKTGAVQSADALPPLDETQTGECVVKAIRKNAVFARFKGTLIPTMELTYAFYFAPADN
jgi:hypothetical protein